MLDGKSEVEGQSYATKSDYDYLARRLESLWEDIQTIKRQIRLLARILVDKKVLGEETAKSIGETLIDSDNDKKLIEWLTSTLKD